MSSTYSAYIRLAIVISKQAALDYEKEWCKFKKTGIKSNEMLELEEFFTSDYGTLCTFGKGKEILAQIQSGVPVAAFDEDDHCVSKVKCRCITYRGVTKPISEWAKTLGINNRTLHRRLNLGWSIEKAFTTPVGGRNGKSEEAI